MKIVKQNHTFENRVNRFIEVIEKIFIKEVIL